MAMSESSANSDLCDDCRLIDFETGRGTKIAGFAGLKESCPLCSWILHHFGEYWPEFLSSRRDSTSPISVSLLSGELLRITLSEVNLPTLRFELFVKSDAQHQPTTRIVGRSIHEDPASEACFSLISGWLSDCLVSHFKCRRGLPSLPKRVIDVRNPRRIFLFEPQAQFPDRYITLSHRWGSSHTLTTTSSNLESHKQHIVDSSLPKTFQDAIFITRKLGFRYLWIDSLCILQDSKDDWATESSMMGYYYSNSTLTLSALGSRSSNESSGILKKREPWPSVKLSSNGIFAREQRPTWTRIMEVSPLSSRGWVLQERLLPSRILHYSDDEILWECLTCSRCEGDSLKVDWLSSDVSRAVKINLFHHNLESISATALFHKWHSVVQHYSTLSLTLEADRLPALSGIASEFCIARDLCYMAGLWKEDPLALLWEVSDSLEDGSQVPMRKAMGAPSWSWISVRGEVSWEHVAKMSDPVDDGAPSPFDTVIIRTHIVPIFGLNPLGEVQPGATISLLAHIKLVKYRYRNPRHLPLEIDIYDEYVELLGSGFLDTARKIIDIENETDANDKNAQRAEAANAKSSTFETCYAARITDRLVYVVDQYSGQRVQSRLVWFLLVKPLDASDGLWTRVGVGTTEIRNCNERGYFGGSTLREITLV